MWPGRPVVDVIESGRMELRAKIDESDRTNLVEGQVADVSVDSLPGRNVQGEGRCALRAREPRRLVRTDREHVAAVRRHFQFETLDPQLKAGASARVFIEGKEVARRRCTCRDRRYSRRTARTTSSSKVGDRFEPREVKVVQRTESRDCDRGCRRRGRDRAGRPHRRREAVAGSVVLIAAARGRASERRGSPARPPTFCPTFGSVSRTSAPTSFGRC